jgi:hypothetical protein
MYIFLDIFENNSVLYSIRSGCIDNMDRGPELT